MSAGTSPVIDQQSIDVGADYNLCRWLGLFRWILHLNFQHLILLYCSHVLWHAHLVTQPMT